MEESVCVVYVVIIENGMKENGNLACYFSFSHRTKYYVLLCGV